MTLERDGFLETKRREGRGERKVGEGAGRDPGNRQPKERGGE